MPKKEKKDKNIKKLRKTKGEKKPKRRTKKRRIPAETGARARLEQSGAKLKVDVILPQEPYKRGPYKPRGAGAGGTGVPASTKKVGGFGIVSQPQQFTGQVPNRPNREIAQEDIRELRRLQERGIAQINQRLDNLPQQLAPPNQPQPQPVIYNPPVYPAIQAPTYQAPTYQAPTFAPTFSPTISPVITTTISGERVDTSQAQPQTTPARRHITPRRQSAPAPAPAPAPSALARAGDIAGAVAGGIGEGVRLGGVVAGGIGDIAGGIGAFGQGLTAGLRKGLDKPPPRRQPAPAPAPEPSAEHSAIDSAWEMIGGVGISPAEKRIKGTIIPYQPEAEPEPSSPVKRLSPEPEPEPAPLETSTDELRRAIKMSMDEPSEWGGESTEDLRKKVRIYGDKTPVYTEEELLYGLEDVPETEKDKSLEKEKRRQLLIGTPDVPLGRPPTLKLKSRREDVNDFFKRHSEEMDKHGFSNKSEIKKLLGDMIEGIEEGVPQPYDPRSTTEGVAPPDITPRKQKIMNYLSRHINELKLRPYDPASVGVPVYRQPRESEPRPATLLKPLSNQRYKKLLSVIPESKLEISELDIGDIPKVSKPKSKPRIREESKIFSYNDPEETVPFIPKKESKKKAKKEVLDLRTEKQKKKIKRLDIGEDVPSLIPRARKMSPVSPISTPKRRGAGRPKTSWKSGDLEKLLEAREDYSNFVKEYKKLNVDISRRRPLHMIKAAITQEANRDPEKIDQHQENLNYITGLYQQIKQLETKKRASGKK